MRPEAVRLAMKVEPGHDRAVCTNDGNEFTVPGDDSWVAAPEFMIVLDSLQVLHHIAYRHTTAIKHVPQNGHK